MAGLSTEHLVEMLDRVGEALLLLDAEARVLFWNETLARWSGIGSHAAIGRPISVLWDAEDAGIDMVLGAVRESLRFGLPSLYCPSLHLGPLPLMGPQRTRLRQRILVEPMGTACLVRVQDASEVLEREARLAEQEVQLEQQRRALIEQERKMHRVAHFDPVTGLANRAHLRGYLERTVNRTVGDAYGAVCRLDLDGWSAVNQSFGTEFGDRLLRRFGARLSREIRPIDLVSRTDGDEFVVILDDVEPETAEMMCQRLLDVIRRPCALDGEELSVTACAGVALYPDHGSDPEELLHRAQLALTEAKRSGRNRHRVFSPAMDTDHAENLVLLTALQRAVEEPDFELYYQPQARLRDGSLVGTEALIRWRRDGQFVSPARFVPLLEDSGLIVPVGRWVAATAIAQARRWRDLGHRIRVAVNVSVHQLTDDFVRFVSDALEDWGLEPELFEVELTESLLVQDVASCRGKLEALRERGVHIAIDDFGTGYSSLAHLRRFPVDTLKIDRAFTQEVHEPEGQAIVRTVIGLGRVLELEVLAEGVETSQQVEFLRQEGCHAVQGYWLARPMPADACTAWFEEFRGFPARPPAPLGPSAAPAPARAVRTRTDMGA